MLCLQKPIIYVAWSPVRQSQDTTSYYHLFNCNKWRCREAYIEPISNLLAMCLLGIHTTKEGR